MGLLHPQNPRRAVVEAACAWALVVLLPDAVSRGPALLRPAGLAFLLAAAPTLLCWAGLVAGLAALRTRGRVARTAAWTALVALSAFLPLSVGACLRYRAILGEDLPPSAVLFLLRNPRYALSLVEQASSPGFWALLGGGVLAVALALARWSTPVWPLRGRRAGFALAAGLVPFALGLVQAPVTPDVQFAIGLVGGAGLRVFNQQRLPRDPQRVTPAPGATAIPDVVVLIHESLGAYQWRPWSQEPARSPALERFLGSRGDAALAFPRAVSNAAATDVSVPSILTGLAPDAPREAWRRAPLLWQEARALGYRTGLISAQAFEGSRFPDFFLRHDGPDHARTARQLAGPRTVDDGVDDALAIDEAVRFVDATPVGQPLLLVVHFNGTHAPCRVPGEPPGAKFEGRNPALSERCARAADYLSEQTARLLEHLERVGRGERTLVVGTSDHAADTIDPGRPPRVESYDEHALHVPLFVVLPRALLPKNPGWSAALQANRAARVSNVDLYPTILDVWGRWPLAAGDARPRLEGRSLLRPVEAERIVVVSSTNDIRAWSRDGFAMYRGPWKWVVDDRLGVRAFRWDEDPGDERDVWPSLPAEVRAAFLAEAGARPALARILGRVESGLARH